MNDEWFSVLCDILLPKWAISSWNSKQFSKVLLYFFQYYSIIQSCPNSVKGWGDFLLGSIYQLKSKLAWPCVYKEYEVKIEMVSGR